MKHFGATFDLAQAFPLSNRLYDINIVNILSAKPIENTFVDRWFRQLEFGYRTDYFACNRTLNHIQNQR